VVKLKVERQSKVEKIKQKGKVLEKIKQKRKVLEKIKIKLKILYNSACSRVFLLRKK